MSDVTAQDVIGIVRKTGMKWALGNLDPDKKLTEQGADSLDMTTLVFEIEETFGVTISDESLGEGQWNSISRIVENVNRLKHAASS